MSGGHIRKRGKSSWEVKFDLGRDPPTGKHIIPAHLREELPPEEASDFVEAIVKLAQIDVAFNLIGRRRKNEGV